MKIAELEKMVKFKALWGESQGTLDEWGEAVILFLRGLADCHDVFRTWESLNRKKVTYSVDTGLDISEVKKELLAGRNRSDRNRKVIAELGYSFNVQTRIERGYAALLMIGCGRSGGTELDHLLLGLPPAPQVPRTLSSQEGLYRLMRVIVTVFRPDWCCLATPELLRLVETYPRPRAPYAGLMLYLDKPRGRMPELPSPSRVVDLDGFGDLMILDEDLLGKPLEHYVGLARNVDRILWDAGMLKSTPQLFGSTAYRDPVDLMPKWMSDNLEAFRKNT